MKITGTVPKTQMGMHGVQGVPTGTLTADEIEAIFTSSQLQCPMKQAPISPGECLSCKYFHSIGEVQMTLGTEPVPPERRFRILCRHPKKRRLHPCTVEIPKKQSDYLARHIKQAARTTMHAELKHFVEEPRSINCPIARAKTGVWNVQGAPCPACEYYKGLTREGKEVICGHVQSIRFQRIVFGASILF